MLVTFMRCEWRGGSRRLIKAAGMLIGGGHCCPLCSAASDWASVAPVKGQGTDLKSVTLTPHHPPASSPTTTHICTQIIPPMPHPHPPQLSPSHSSLLGYSRKKMEPFCFSHFLPRRLIRWLVLNSLHHLWSVWPLAAPPRTVYWRRTSCWF